MRKFIVAILFLSLALVARAGSPAGRVHPFVGLEAGYPGFAGASVGMYTPRMGYWYLDGKYRKDSLFSDDDSLSDEVSVGAGYLCRIVASRSRKVNFYLGAGLYGGMQLHPVVEEEESQPESFEELESGSPQSRAFFFDLGKGRYWGVEPRASVEFFIMPHCSLNVGCAYARSRAEASLGINIVF